MSQPEVSPVSVSKRRRRWPFVVLGVLLLLLVALAAAPSMIGGFAAGKLSSSFGEDYQGKLELAGLDLSWTGRQALREARLVDPEGREIARVSADLPSLLDLATSGGAKLGRIEVRARAELVADENGVTNLDRALAARPGREKKSADDDEPSSTDLGELLRELELELDIVVERLSWSDATTRAAGQPFAIDDLKLLVKAEPGQPLRVDVDGQLSGLSSGAIRAKAAISDLFNGAELNPAARFELEAKLDELPSALIDTLARQDGLVAMALGPNFRVSASGAGTFSEGKLELSVVGPDGTLDFRGELADGVLGGRTPATLELALKPKAAALEHMLRAKLPEGVSLVAVGAPNVNVRVADLRIEVQRILDTANSNGDVVAAAVGATRLSLTVSTNPWSASGPFAPNTSLEVGALALRTSLRPAAGKGVLRLDFDTELAVASKPAEAVRWTLSLDCPDLAQALSLGESGVLSPTKLETTLSELPRALLVALAPDSAATIQKLPAGAVKLATSVEFAPSKPAQVDTLASLGAGALELTLKAAITDAFGLATKRGAGELPPVSAQLEVRGASVVRAFVPEAHADTVLELLGESLKAQLELRPASGSAGISDVDLDAKLAAARVDLSMGLRLREQKLSILEATPLALEVRPGAAMVQRYVGASLPEGATLTFADADPKLTVRLSELELPLDAWLAEASTTAKPLNAASTATAVDPTFAAQPPNSATAPMLLGDTVRRTDATLRVDLPALTLTQPAVGGGPAVPISVEALNVQARLAASKPAQFDVAGSISGAKPSSIALRATSADLGAFLDGFAAQGGVPASAALQLSGDVANLPTALVDALAGQNGLLVDVLGPEMNFKLAGAWPSAAGDPLRAEMTSSTASVKLEADLNGMVLSAPETGGIDAQLPLSPLFSERIVGKLLPLCVNARKPQGASPVNLSVRKFQLPLDGDLSKLNAVVELELGDILYDLLPGLSSALAPLGLQGASQGTAKLGKMTLPIVNGVVSYDRLPISIGGKEIAFRGAFDLAKLEFDLATDVPLDALGSKVSGELDKLRQYLDPNMLVPVQLKGTWKSPKLRLADDFTKNILKEAAEKAAGDALKGGLQDLLGGKKKKP